MRVTRAIFNPFTQAWQLPEVGDTASILEAAVAAIQVTPAINTVAGTAVDGVLSNGDKTFTRDTEFWVDAQVITIDAVTATVLDAKLRVGEHVVEGTSGADGIVRESVWNAASSTGYIVVDTITVALFTGGESLTGDNSGVVATGTTVQTKVTDLTNQVVWTYKDPDVGVGALQTIVSNTATAITTGAAMFTAGDKAILFVDDKAAVQAMDVIQYVAPAGP